MPPQPQQSYGLPPSPIRQPLPAYGPPALQTGPVFPKHGAGCDGWKPIPGPSVGAQAIANSNIASIPAIPSIVPENSYLPPQSNSLHSLGHELHLSDGDLHVQPLPTNLQLPVAEASTFNHDLGANIATGLGLTNINVVKSEGIEVRFK